MSYEQGQSAAATEHTYKVAMAACKARAGIDKPDFWQRAERIVDAIHRRTGVPPSAEVTCRLAMTYVLGKEWAKAAAIFEQVVSVFRGPVCVLVWSVVCTVTTSKFMSVEVNRLFYVLRLAAGGEVRSLIFRSSVAVTQIMVTRSQVC